MKRRSNNKAIFFLLLIALIIIILSVIIVSYGEKYNMPNLSMKVFNISYTMSSLNCFSSEALRNSSGLDLTCIEIINSTANSTIPNYFIISYYRFINSSDAALFVDSLSTDLNTTPWPNEQTKVGLAGNITYTEIIFPNYENTNATAVVLGAYKRNGGDVLEVSTGNFTGGSIIATKEAILQVLNYSSSKLWQK